MLRSPRDGQAFLEDTITNDQGIVRTCGKIGLAGQTKMDIKKISKHIQGVNYSPFLVFEFNKELREALLL